MSFNIIWLTPDRFDLKPNKSPWIEMSKSFISRGHRVTVLTSRSKNEQSSSFEYDSYFAYVKSIDIPLIFRLSVLFNMFLWLKKNSKPSDIIILNQDALLIFPFLRLIRINNIHLDIRTIPVEVHTIKDRLDRFLFWYLPLKLFGKSVHSYSFITDRLKLEVEKEFALNVEDFTIWQSGVSTEVFYPKESDAIRKNFQLFYHGSISLNRGIDLVIKALALIDREVDIEFVIVGGGSGLQMLKDLTNELALNERVQLRGLIPYEHITEEISKADICICPLTDRLEWQVSSPIKVFEYLACGKPMVLTPISAHKDVVGDASYVVWTKGFEPIDFKNAILEALSNREELLVHAKLSPEIVRQRYEWRCQADKLLSYLEKTMSDIL